MQAERCGAVCGRPLAVATWRKWRMGDGMKEVRQYSAALLTERKRTAYLSHFKWLKSTGTDWQDVEVLLRPAGV